MPEDLASQIPDLSDLSIKEKDAMIYAHIFGVIGDWYISGISKDRETAFGFRSIDSEKEWEMDSWFKNQSEWGEFSIPFLQKLVNTEFLKEKDIRFLIVRDLYWEPKKLSQFNTENATLIYPGNPA
tara:strand:+ start:8143 stop:8520 length:378 start_codon:yes stop_codon:yes gene_type:complete